jgi:hypothetical protein
MLEENMADLFRFDATINLIKTFCASFRQEVMTKLQDTEVKQLFFCFSEKIQMMEAGYEKLAFHLKRKPSIPH